MAPGQVFFDSDEIDRVMRIRMAHWWGISLAEWDAMSYKDQCDSIEIRRADHTIAQFDAEKRRTLHTTQNVRAGWRRN